MHESILRSVPSRKGSERRPAVRIEQLIRPPWERPSRGRRLLSSAIAGLLIAVTPLVGSAAALGESQASVASHAGHAAKIAPKRVVDVATLSRPSHPTRAAIRPVRKAPRIAESSTQTATLPISKVDLSLRSAGPTQPLAAQGAASTAVIEDLRHLSALSQNGHAPPDTQVGVSQTR